jgi:hypothetical protein
MNELKKSLDTLLARFRSKSVIVCLFAGLLTAGGLSAQQSASHTVTIRIIRPIQFSIETAANESGKDYRSKDAGMWLKWKSDSKPKRVTVSRMSGYSDEVVDLSTPAGNSLMPVSHMRLAATEAHPADEKDRLFFTVMDI